MRGLASHGCVRSAPLATPHRGAGGIHAQQLAEAGTRSEVHPIDHALPVAALVAAEGRVDHAVVVVDVPVGEAVAVLVHGHAERDAVEPRDDAAVEADAARDLLLSHIVLADSAEDVVGNDDRP